MADVSVQTLDYSAPFANITSPVASFTQGLQGGFAMQQGQLQQQMQRYQFGRMQQMQHSAAQVASNPTPENISQLSIAFPEMSEQFKRSYDMLRPQQQRADLQHMTGVYAAVQNGRPDIAAGLLRDRAAALKNSGAQPPLINAANAMADWAEQHPDTFKTSAGVMLASIMGPDKFSQAFKDVTEAQTGQEAMPAKVAQAGAEASKAITTAQLEPAKVSTDIANVASQITQRAGQLAIDRDKLMTDAQVKLREMNLQYGTLQDDQRKLVNDSVVDSTAGQQSAARLNDLADRIDAVDQAGRANGRISDWGEIGRQAFGSEDATSALKQEYARIVNNGALGSIKQALGGRVTDVDMKVAMGPVPSPNANPAVVISYLRGVAKIQLVDAARQEAQGEWLAKGGRQQTLGPAVKDMEIMGTKVPAGTTFAEFSRQFVGQKADQIAAQSTLARAQGRGYLKYVTPGADGQQSDVPAAAPPGAAGAAAPAPGPAQPTVAAPAQGPTEMDHIASQLATLGPQREALKKQVDGIERDIATATSLAGRRHFTPDMVQQMRAQHSASAAQLATLQGQIDQLNAQGRTAAMVPAGAPPQYQSIINRYTSGQ